LTTESDNKEQTFGIEPYKLYRRNDPITKAILGLADSTIDEEIAKGTIPPPVRLTAHGKSCGWVGATLIQIIKNRLAQVAALPTRPPRQKKNKQERP
jgi:predicted DNA-binding transcriptional regulator AlpA